MCGTCGCSTSPELPETVVLEQDILSVNNRFAEKNRQLFDKKKVTALNLVSSPGSGKTTLLEKTLSQLNNPCAVIVGDQYTDKDAQRISRVGVDVIQINTGKSCHLDAHQVAHAFESLSVAGGYLFIENVGNLVCPALFDLGENQRVSVLSVTEGDDKPIKYQEMFSSSHCVIINKIDLLPYVDFDMEQCINTLVKLSPNATIICLSATTGEGMDNWLKWLSEQMTRQHEAVSY